MTIIKHHKVIILVALLIITSAVLFVPAHNAFATHEKDAQGNPIVHPATTNKDAGFLKNFTEGLALPVLAGAGAILYLIQWILIALLSFASYLLINAFNFNLAADPSGMIVTLEGWRIMRDLANGLFLILMLWVAISIIFDAVFPTSYSGKAFFWKIVGVALLVNFSMVAVTAAFGFTNYVANIFAQKIQVQGPDGLPSMDIAAFIIQETRFHQVMSTITKGDVQKIKDLEEQAKKKVLLDPPLSTKDRMLATLGVQPAHAVVATGACGVGALVGFFTPLPGGAAAGCIVGGLLGAVVDGIFGTSAGLFEAALKFAGNIAITNIFLLVLIVAFTFGALALFQRLVMILILTIVAPIAFLSYALPGKQTAALRNWWFDNLVTWAFFAPIYYFWIYIGLFMLQQYNISSAGSNGETAGFLGNTDRILQLVFVLFFFYYAGTYAKKMSSGLSNFVTGVATKAASVGLGYATGGLTLAAGAATGALGRQAAPVLAARMEAREKAGKKASPFITRGLERRMHSFQQQQTSEMAGKRDEYKKLPPEHLKRELDRVWFKKDKVAIGLALKDKGKLDSLRPDQKKNLITWAKDFGAQKELLEAEPHLAANTAEAQKITQELRSNQFIDVDRDALVKNDRDTPEEKAKKDAALKGILFNTKFSSDILKRMAEKDIEVGSALIKGIHELTDKFDTLPENDQKVLNNLETRLATFFTSTTGQGLFGGGMLPKRWEKHIAAEELKKETEKKERERKEREERRPSASPSIGSQLGLGGPTGGGPSRIGPPGGGPSSPPKPTT